MINVEIDTNQISAELNRLLARTGNLSPALREIGEILTESTKQRFASTTGPDGQQWAPNPPSMLDRKRGSRPLTDEGTLGDTIDYQLQGADALLIGSPMEYAAMQQFGGTKAEFPFLWGDIPARPFLGISSEDRSDILDSLTQYLQN
ncbi:phage virion morphogenesis protein [Methylobacter tundripaludum]|uniref:phage virion morphogenesis protein n=1 Tax=Methylobacter tundripaludum TaxID=173365 RepID=UPI000568041D|nr:phage virion morphogenesis protein [Methylobacter tundripaludum]